MASRPRAPVAILLASVAAAGCRNEANVEAATLTPTAVPRTSANPSDGGAAAERNSSDAAAGEKPATAPRPAAPAQPWPLTPPPAVSTDWCTESVTPLDEETCFVLPDRPTRRLLIYLHGVVPPTASSPQKTNYQRVVANASQRAGVAALLPRGLQGNSKRFPRWWTWPMGAGAYGQHVPGLLARFEQNQRRLEKLTGVEFDRVYVAGSSAGAYFVSQLVLRGDLDADGFGALSGGAGRHSASLSEMQPRPFYIGYGKSDSVGQSARALGALLETAGWPVQLAVHLVPHGAHEIYLDEAFPFWAKHEK